MKLLIVCAYYLLALTSPTVECHKPSQECQELHHVTAAELDAFDRAEYGPSEIRSRHKCYVNCLLQRTDYLNELGKVSLEKFAMREDIAEEQLDVITECKAKHDVEDDPCEYGFGIMTCLMTVIERA